MSGRSATWELAGALRRGGGDRRRRLWTAAAAGGAGTLACAAASIAALAADDVPVCRPLTTLDSDSGGLHCFTPPQVGDLAPYLAQPGTRSGVVFAATVLVVPFLVLVGQLLRFGSAARERRLAGMVVAGAGPRELRRIGAVEAARDAVPGALAALGGYLLLWLALRVALPSGWRMMPSRPWYGLLAWPIVATALVGLAALAGARAARPAVLTPIGLGRRVPRPLTRRERLTPAVLVLALGVSVSAFWISSWLDETWLLLSLALLLAAAVSLGPVLVGVVGRALVRRGDVVAVLAGRRLLADVRTPGRACGVLAAAGVAVGIQGWVLVASAGSVSVEFVVGFGFSVAGVLVAVTVAGGAMALGAAEQVLDTMRPAAALAALGAGRAEARAVVRTGLRGVAVGSALVGVLLGVAFVLVELVLEGDLTGAVVVVGAGVLAALAAAGSAWLAATAATVAVRGRIDASLSPQNLRTA